MTTKWHFHSNSIKIIDRELQKVESNTRRSDRERRPHLVRKWESKKYVLLAKRQQHTKALMDGWRRANQGKSHDDGQ